ncbi:MAG: hypothetical protein WAU39_01875 [Polyangiales bacterium]
MNAPRPYARNRPRGLFFSPSFLSFPATSQSIPRWNQIMEWLSEVQRIREIAGDVAA